MKYSGIFHLGIPKAALSDAGAKRGDHVDVTLERDVEPLPADVIPDDLARALEAHPPALVTFEDLAPAHRREHVKHVLAAKKPETRARRVAQIAQTLRAGPPPRRTWSPKK